jgi:hypothetical protein
VSRDLPDRRDLAERVDLHIEMKLRGPQAFVLWVLLLLVAGLWVKDVTRMMDLSGCPAGQTETRSAN